MTAASSTRVAAGLLALAAAGHALAIPHHAEPGHGGALHGAAFAAVAIAQLVAAAAMARRPTEDRLRQLVVASSGALIAVWAVSRTVGLPYGPHPGAPEAVGVLDALTVAAQLGVVGLLARRSRRPLPMAFASSFAVVVVGVAAFHIADVATPAGATPHSHAGADAAHDDSSGVSVEAGSPAPTVSTSHEHPERVRAVEPHSHEGATDHAHP